MDVGLNRKKHILIFETEQGKMLVGTDDLQDVAEQPWFRTFLNLSRAPQMRSAYEEPKQLPPIRDPLPQIREMPREMPRDMPPPPPQIQQQQMPPQRPLSTAPRASRPNDSFLSVPPNEMTDDVWTRLTPEQQDAYIKNYNL